MKKPNKKGAKIALVQPKALIARRQRMEIEAKPETQTTLCYDSNGLLMMRTTIKGKPSPWLVVGHVDQIQLTISKASPAFCKMLWDLEVNQLAAELEK